LTPRNARGFWLIALERRARKLPDLRKDMVTRDEAKEWRGVSKIPLKIIKRDVEVRKRDVMLIEK
jgi:hypothetical protein